MAIFQADAFLLYHNSFFLRAMQIEDLEPFQCLSTTVSLNLGLE